MDSNASVSNAPTNCYSRGMLRTDLEKKLLGMPLRFCLGTLALRAIPKEGPDDFELLIEGPDFSGAWPVRMNRQTKKGKLAHVLGLFRESAVASYELHSTIDLELVLETDENWIPTGNLISHAVRASTAETYDPYHDPLRKMPVHFNPESPRL